MRAKNESKLIGEAYTQVHEGIADHVRKSAARGAVPAEFDASRHAPEHSDSELHPATRAAEGMIGADVMWDGRRKRGIVDEVDVERGIAVVTDHEGNEHYVDLGDFDVVLDPNTETPGELKHDYGIEDQEYDKEEDYWTPEVKPDIRGLKNIPALPDDHPLSDKSEKEAREFAQRAIKTDDEEDEPKRGITGLQHTDALAQAAFAQKGETHKPYVSSYIPFHRDEDSKLKPSKKIFAVLDKHGNAVFTSNSKLEAYKWFKTNYDNI